MKLLNNKFLQISIYVRISTDELKFINHLTILTRFEDKGLLAKSTLKVTTEDINEGNRRVRNVANPKYLCKCR